MADIEWAIPPETKGPGRKRVIFTDEQVDALRANPNRWACIKRSASGSRNAYLWAKANPEFEVVTRRAADGKRDIFARFVDGKAALRNSK